LAAVSVAFVGCNDEVLTTAAVLPAPSGAGAAGQAGPATSPVYTFPGGRDQMLIDGASVSLGSSGPMSA
jgi:hypothetical protein